MFIAIAIFVTLLGLVCVPRLVRPFEAGYGIVTIGACILYIGLAIVFWTLLYYHPNWMH